MFDEKAFARALVHFMFMETVKGSFVVGKIRIMGEE